MKTNIKELKQVAKEVNEVMGLNPPIDLNSSYTDLTTALTEVSRDIEDDDPFSYATKRILQIYTHHRPIKNKQQPDAVTILCAYIVKALQKLFSFSSFPVKETITIINIRKNNFTIHIGELFELYCNTDYTDRGEYGWIDENKRYTTISKPVLYQLRKLIWDKDKIINTIELHTTPNFFLNGITDKLVEEYFKILKDIITNECIDWIHSGKDREVHPYRIVSDLEYKTKK